MTGRRCISVLLLLVSVSIATVFGLSLGSSIPGGAVDLQVVYYGTKCLLEHHDPYELDELRNQYVSARRMVPAVSTESPDLVAVYIYLPPTFVIIAPLAVMPWLFAKMLWMVLLVGVLFVAGVLIAEEGSRYARGVALLLTCFVLANCEVGLALGNSAVLVVSLCTIATWCLLRKRQALLATILLTVALAVKPHDAVLIFLYFLLAGGVYRKWAMRSLVLWGAIGLASVIWVSQVAPHWLHAWQANIAAEAVRGGISDPGLNAAKGRGAGQVIDLQAALSVLRDEPSFYNPVAYAICGGLTVIWVLTTVRAKFSETRAWLAIAAIVPLSLLPTYHRPYDTKLLLLAIPACAMLWREGGWRGRGALAVTTTALVCTADLPLTILSEATARVDVSQMGLFGRMCMMPVLRPAPLALLALAVFYLRVYTVHAQRRTGRSRVRANPAQD